MAMVDVGAKMDLQKSIKSVMRRPSVRPPIILMATVLLLVYSAGPWITSGHGMELDGGTLPAKTTNISVLNATQASVVLKMLESELGGSPGNVNIKLEYRSQWDSDDWRSVNVSGVCDTSSLASDSIAPLTGSNCWEHQTGYYYMNVTGLKYPNAHYDFCIYVALDGPTNTWSAPSCVAVKTKAAVPRRPPQMDTGSFFSILTTDDEFKRDIYVYWRPIDETEKCGDKFAYHVYYTTVTTDNETIIHPSNVTGDDYAKFEGLRTSIGYNITVYSSNEEGLSTRFSTVYAPSESNKQDKPLSFTKMVYNESGVYELTWKHVISSRKPSSTKLQDYTLFWCEKYVDHPFQCNGYMNWTRIPKSLTSQNMTVLDNTKDYLFGISANMHVIKTHGQSHSRLTTISSGLVWETCILLPDNRAGKIENIRVGYISTTFVELRWTIDCSSKIGTILGYRLYHCPVVSESNATCIEPMMNKQISGEIVHRSRNFAFFRNLMPYTPYMFSVALITTHGEGLISDPIVRTTLEGPPDVRNLSLNVTRVTNTSVDISWTPPKFTNGVVRYYRVHYCLDDVFEQDLPRDLLDIVEDQKLITDERNVTVQDTKCRLENLESYRHYNITVSACTTKCSDRTFPIQVLTGVGYPGRIPQPSVLFKNMTGIVISWHRPMNPRGPIAYYQVIVLNHSGPLSSQTAYGGSILPTKLVYTLTHENPDNSFYQIDGNTNVFRVRVPACSPRDKRQMFYYAVRAVNNNPQDSQKPFYGPWSVPGSIKCL